ncbi:MAG: methyltransferase [Crocinitomicaceae bacterium]
MTEEYHLSEEFWDNRYQENNTQWDLSEVSPPLKAYIDQLTNKDLRILIPGAGNAHEASYLLEHGFTNITVVDIAPTLVKRLQEKIAGNSHIQIIHKDFFQHKGTYDLILEQTFFCALNPDLRTAYAKKMSELLAKNGQLVGLLFNREFEENGPPYTGTETEYRMLFEKYFQIETMELCYNSFFKRENAELFIRLKKS